MGDVYRVSSSVKVQQMEAELSNQLSALRVEIEERGLPQGAVPSKSYSSVLPPKDISSFRVEREHGLRRGLQVAEALPVQSQADVMQKELESCLSLEYTPDSLPPLLHQFFTDRSYHLAQIKHQLMLRWRRFCHHTSITEKLYPHYKDQVSYLTREYEDAVQRARRLSASREQILTGRGNSANLLTQGDVVIYLRWLVCHLHSVQTVHNFLRVLHYLPASERNDKEFQPTVTKEETSHQPQHADGVSGLSDRVPLHTVHLEEFLTELQSLIASFHLPYDVQKLRSPADEMELFSTVWKEFRTIFTQQQQMKTFPQYDSTEIKESQWGRKSGSLALKREANWIPFIQVKPRRDPWQQKLVMKLKEKKCVDELLKMHCRFVQVPDLFHVAAALKEHAARVGNLQPTLTSSVSHNSNAKRQKIHEVWTSIYNAASLTQETLDQSSGDRRQDKRSLSSSATNESYSLEDSLHLLGLDDNLEEGTSDPIVARGAYLSLIYLRHLKLRQLQRISLGMLNYLRSVERTLTFDLAGLQLQEQELWSTAEETGWMNAARGGRGEAGGLGSMQYSHNTPVDYKVHCSEFMEFAEVENLHDFYSCDERLIHTQDQRGFYIVYSAALKDLEELKNHLLLIGSQFIQRNRIKKMGKAESSIADIHSWAGLDIDRVAVLLDLWTCETEFLESKVQLLNCYYEAYQHAAGSEERFALARVITDIMHSRPELDLHQDYFVQSYRAEIDCLQSHRQLVKVILDNQIEKQRQYLHRIWRNDRKGSINHYGLPPNYISKHLVSLGGSSPALTNVFFLEVHPSLCLASAVYHGLVQAHTELCQLHQSTSVSEKLVLKQKLLRLALQSWNSLASLGISYSSQIQKDLFSDVFFEDPISVQKVGLMLERSTEETNMKQGREKESYAVETLSKLLELVTIRHRLLESASETAYLAQLYRNVSSELGFDEFHLYLRPVQFEVAEQKERTGHRPVFITAILDDDSSVDRFTPSHMPLSIQELDENQIGRFSFGSEEAVICLMNRESIENLQLTLACQVTQKNALLNAVKLASLCYWADNGVSPAESSETHLDKDVKSSATLDSKLGSDATNLQESSSLPKGSMRTPATTKEMLMGAFVSIQLEKVGVRDEMLNSFMKTKQARGGLIKTPEEAAKIKRGLIVDFLKKFNTQVSQYGVRAQIIAYYYSLMSLLHDIPSIRQSHFTIGQASEPKVILDSGVCPDPRTLQRRPQQLMTEDGKTLLNLWFIPHFSDVLHMFKTQDVLADAEALRHTLQIVSALHDIIYYLVGFSRLGNTEERGQDVRGSHVAAGWGGSEGIGAELLEIQQQIEHLSNPSSPESVGCLLQLRRQVLFLQFDTAVRQLIREAFLSSGDAASYQSVSDNMATALPCLSDSIQADMFSLTLPVPRPLEPQSCQAQTMFPWRSFMACEGLLPVRVWDVPHIESCMQLCLSGLSDRSRVQANAAILGVSLLTEDVLNSGREAEPVRLHGNKDDFLLKETAHQRDESCQEGEREEEKSTPPLQDPIRVQSVLKGFLLLTKQLLVFKESWAQRRLGVEVFNTPTLYQQFVKHYRDEILCPSMKALAQKLGKERDYEILMSGSQSLLPPPGASEVDVTAWQLHKLLESTECDMIREVQRRINRELTQVVSERTRQDPHLPTELWKKSPLKYSLSLERPQLVETFIQQLMDGAEEAEGQLRVSQDHLQLCLTHLGSSLMERERRSFLLYAQFYEQILQQETQLLYQKEQDLKNLKNSQMDNSHKEVSVACRGMMTEISALQARVVHLEEEKNSLEEQLSLKFKKHYNPLVWQLFSTCIQLKARLDDYPCQMEQDVSAMVNRVRAEGVERILKIKKKYSCKKDSDGITATQLKKEEVHELNQENSQLTSLLCKLKALNRWRQVVDQEKLHRQLLQTQEREITSRTEALRVKMTSEEKAIFLQEELDVARQMLSRCQAECSSTKKLLRRKMEELQVARHQSAQEARSRQELDSYRVQSLEQMRADMEDRDRQLRELSEQLDRGSRMQHLQRQRSAKEIRQVKGQLQQERCLKQEAFQQVDKLKNQVNSMEAAFSTCTPTTGQNRTYYTQSVSRLSARSPSAGLHRASQQQLALQVGSITNYAAPQEFATEPRHQRAETARGRSNTRIDRSKVDPSRLRVLTAETLLPDL